MQADVLDIQGQSTGRSVQLPEEIFGTEPNEHVVYLAVKKYLAAQRQGTHKVKTRAEVQGASRKLHKQKGTGGARKGNIRNPLYKGGGTIFGPKPHGYTIKLNRKVKDLAKISALSFKASENAIVVVEDVVMDTPKTKQFFALMTALNVADKKALFVIPEYNDALFLSSRNIPNAATTLLSDINTYDIVNADVLVMTESTAKIFNEEDVLTEDESASSTSAPVEVNGHNADDGQLAAGSGAVAVVTADAEINEDAEIDEPENEVVEAPVLQNDIIEDAVDEDISTEDVLETDEIPAEERVTVEESADDVQSGIVSNDGAVDDDLSEEDRKVSDKPND